MRALLATADGMTLVALGAGAAIGLLWLVNLPLGLALTGVAAPIGAILLLRRTRWLDVGVHVAAIGLVPSLAYRIAGPPALPTPLPEDAAPIELMAPGAAYLLFVVGVVLIVLAGIAVARMGRGRRA